MIKHIFFSLTAVWRSPVALPLEPDEVRQVVLQAHARRRRVAPVVHLAAPGKRRKCASVQTNFGVRTERLLQVFFGALLIL